MEISRTASAIVEGDLSRRLARERVPRARHARADRQRHARAARQAKRATGGRNRRSPAGGAGASSRARRAGGRGRATNCGARARERVPARCPKTDTPAPWKGPGRGSLGVELRETGEQFVSARTKEIFGLLRRRGSRPRGALPRRLIYPDDRERVSAPVNRSFRLNRSATTSSIASSRAGRGRGGRRARKHSGTSGASDSDDRFADRHHRPPARRGGLAESEARFRSLTKLSTDFFWETDVADRFTSVEVGKAYRGVRNVAWSKLGKTRWEIPHVSPDEAARTRTAQ